MNLVVHSNPENLEAEILVVGLSRHPENTKGWQEFSERFNGKLEEWTKELSFDMKSLITYPTLSGSIPRVLFVGLNDRKKLTEDDLRAAFGQAGKELMKKKIKNAAVYLDSFQNDGIDAENAAYLAAEGITLGAYRFDDYKTSSNEADNTIETLSIISEEEAEEVEASAFIGQVFGQSVNEARTLVNMPGNLLTATALADYAKELGDSYGFETDIMGKAELEELGMGAILAVNQGSVEEPRLIVLKYKATESFEKPLALVGKGITFDTGGYSLKPKDGIVGMKGDMGGAAAVLGAMKVIGELKPEKNVIAVIASTDNMVSGNAFKPDDVITSLSGKTIEILNTDAEGRLVLADSVTYAKQLGATHIVDVATLTGGVIVALGKDKTGALTNDEAFFETFMEAALETGEFVWRLPLTESDKKRIRKSDVADLNNSPGRDGHMIFGGGFVGEFAEETPWIHLDIAGTSDAGSAHDLGPKGGTGVMVRTLAMLVERMAEEQ
ncbi:leucyl aminopeptidase [Planomicrobium sp. CPCC 101110]|uniref:leucyl aminopeptidase n=1 Tax=Planomicrobium sp. CPCC 101110 TaxID=2599619 RepID=UPI0011B54D21|nr:leucyl aminopeptidase [Planomicrobium sp. CPCC 101110]TWT24406.1 leucyl aminopeptidase [Planomicrobium sp. CPCC 101110]